MARLASLANSLLILATPSLSPDGQGLALIYQYLRRVICDDDLDRDVRHGLARGYPLPTLLLGLYVQALDEWLAALGLFYVRFMDDWVVLAPTRYKLRVAIKVVNRTLAELEVEKHLGRTTLGRNEAGSDFWDFHFSPRGLSLIQRNIDPISARKPGSTSTLLLLPASLM